ncbi:MmgE/PrpD family protein [Actinomycetospora termitidis]|uniref:MmgE/PrpD family protein n=1 Tax=Actinomycetospora termitidis TaxID=3053470 RepID=A0ABT7M3D8_9PSEU|nr:MmgE/PrpD family protein [Actinomycetospora sp. Odt1-22]MDL5155164.1 MmgE/PrpD family protein [Actinomycetospora sp. Odt1-22]
MSTLGRLASRARAAADDADAAARREAGRQVLDVLGCLASGASHPLARTWLPLVAEDPGGVALPGVPGRRRPEDAAEVGGVLAHLDELDPLHAPSAMALGAVVVPTVLALGGDHSGTDLARAVVAGYEAGAVVSLSFGGPSLYATGRWPTAVFGPIAAAAAAAVLLDLDEATTTTALALASTSLGGLLSADVLGHGHYLLGGTAARAGLRAALGARAGLTASTTLLDGPAAAAFGRAPDPPSGSGPHLLATGSKRWPCSRPLQSALAALDELADRGVRPGDGDVVTVALPAAARAFVTATEVPDDATTAAASASVAVRGHAVGRATEPGWYREVAAGLAHGPRVTVVLAGAPDLDAAFPARWGAHVELRGETATCLVPPGDPAAPLPDDVLLARTAALTGSEPDALAPWLDPDAVTNVGRLVGP